MQRKQRNKQTKQKCQPKTGTSPGSFKGLIHKTIFKNGIKKNNEWFKENKHFCIITFLFLSSFFLYTDF